MHYNCFNCDKEIDLPEVTSLKEETAFCPNCFAHLQIEAYKQCDNCNYYFLKTESHCLNCNKSTDRFEPAPKLNYEYIKNEQDYHSALEHIERMDIISFDTEGNDLDPFQTQLLMIQLGNEEIAYVFPPKWHKNLGLENFWNDKSKTFLVHNAKFDCKVLKHTLGIMPSNIFDTMLAERIITCGKYRKNSLRAVTHKYLNIDIEKEIRMDFSLMTLKTYKEKVTEELIKYAAYDIQLLPIIYRKQLWQLHDEDLYKIAKLEFELVKVISEMELNGIYVDVKRWRGIIEICRKEKLRIKNEIVALLKKNDFSSDMFGDISLNFNSTLVLKKLFEYFDIELESTGDTELSQIDHPLAKLIREYRKYEKQLSSFGESFLKLVRKESSRIHPSFQQIGADTGRFSCNKPNLQQIPATEEYRSCFTATKGRKIVTCDYSQQELRLLASLSEDPKFIQMYKDGVDLHSATASMMFDIPIEKVDKETHRRIAKTINFGLAYGSGAKSLGVTIGTDEKEAQAMIDKYFAQFSNIGEWLTGAAEFAQTEGYSKTLMGRKRYYNLPRENNPEYRSIISGIGRKGKNSPIQGSAVDMIKIALVMIDKELKSTTLDAFLINTVHDEIVVECAEEDAKKASEIVEKCMVKAGERLAPNVPIVAEACIEDFWTH